MNVFSSSLLWFVSPQLLPWKEPSSWASATLWETSAPNQTEMSSCRTSLWWRASSCPGTHSFLHFQLMHIFETNFRVTILKDQFTQMIEEILGECETYEMCSLITRGLVGNCFCKSPFSQKTFVTVGTTQILSNSSSKPWPCDVNRHARDLTLKQLNGIQTSFIW